MAFDMAIPEVEQERTMDDILKHLADTTVFGERVNMKKEVEESVDMVIAYINKELSYSDALQNIHSIGDGLGMKAITLAPLVIDLNEAREIMGC